MYHGTRTVKIRLRTCVRLAHILGKVTVSCSFSLPLLPKTVWEVEMRLQFHGSEVRVRNEGGEEEEGVNNSTFAMCVPVSRSLRLCLPRIRRDFRQLLDGSKRTS